MRPEEIEKVIASFGPVRFYPNPFGVLGEVWFLLEARPTPPSGERFLVAADIRLDRIIRVDKDNGMVFHSPNCDAQEHILSKRLTRVVENIADQTFYVAVFPGHPSVLSGQPIAIALEPVITYNDLPDHPHLNQGGLIRKSFYLPDSLCYTNDPVGLGTNIVDRLLKAFVLICIWLFRHQIWMATRQLWGQGIWIGPQDPPLSRTLQVLHLNPSNICHCGSGAPYSKCHMMSDMEDYLQSVKLPVSPQEMIEYQIRNWQIEKGRPQNEMIQALRSYYI
ncbi:MAG: SEC-C domain-containing protein [Firmicutes bacterium]|nr:SEC-C domain-containing protein [Bacillota bacterium]